MHAVLTLIEGVQQEDLVEVREVTVGDFGDT